LGSNWLEFLILILYSDRVNLTLSAWHCQALTSQINVKSCWKCDTVLRVHSIENDQVDQVGEIGESGLNNLWDSRCR
jgi:hypothetical protein